MFGERSRAIVIEGGSGDRMHLPARVSHIMTEACANEHFWGGNPNPPLERSMLIQVPYRSTTRRTQEINKKYFDVREGG